MSKSNPNVISFRVLMHIAWRNLLYKKLRAFLTVFGVVIGIGAIYFLLSFGIGLQHLVTSQVIGSKSVKSITVTTPNSRIIKLSQASFSKIKNLPHVVQIGASYSYAASLGSHGSVVDAIAYGESAAFEQLDNLNLSSGRLLRDTDTDSALINTTGLKAIGINDPKSAVGKQVSVHIPLVDAAQKQINSTYTIVGVVNSTGSNELYLPNSTFSTAGVEAYGQIELEVDTAAHVAGLRAQIESLGLLTTSPIDTIGQIDQVFRFFNIILAGFGAIGMIVAVLGMFNTLTISLLERTKEIGLMITLGGRNKDMRKLFIFEAVLLSFAGAVIGIACAAIFGQLINFGLNIFSQHRGVAEHFQLFANPWWLVLGLIAFMLFVGLIVVFIPARRAARINPIDALRRE